MKAKSTGHNMLIDCDINQSICETYTTAVSLKRPKALIINEDKNSKHTGHKADMEFVYDVSSFSAFVYVLWCH